MECGFVDPDRTLTHTSPHPKQGPQDVQRHFTCHDGRPRRHRLGQLVVVLLDWAITLFAGQCDTDLQCPRAVSMRSLSLSPSTFPATARAVAALPGGAERAK